MRKKTYIQPIINVVSIACQQLIAVSDVSTSGGVNLGYDKNGGDQGEAW